MEDHFDISGVFEISKFEIAGLACVHVLVLFSLQVLLRQWNTEKSSWTETCLPVHRCSEEYGSSRASSA